MRRNQSKCRIQKWWLSGLVACVLASNVGCLLPLYSGDPARRVRQLIFTSEDLSVMMDEWERIWFLDQPSHMKPFITHGGVI